MSERKQGIWDERTKTFIRAGGTVTQGRRPMYQPHLTNEWPTLTSGNAKTPLDEAQRCPDCDLAMMKRAYGWFECATCHKRVRS